MGIRQMLLMMLALPAAAPAFPTNEVARSVSITHSNEIVSLDPQSGRRTNVTVTIRKAKVRHTGVLGQMRRTNPLQMINPFAPAEAGNGRDNGSHDPLTGQAAGVAIYRVEY